jgi:L-histidine N-alpha-methyltransferase
VAQGLTETPRTIPFRFLYDQRGCALFDEICQQPEYYLTRTEAGILSAHVAEIAALTGSVTLIELGAGSAVKTDQLLAVFGKNNARLRYVPVDVSAASLAAGQRRIAQRYPAVRFRAVVGPYEAAFPLLRRFSPTMLLFLGSSVGNFDQAEARGFWQRVARHLAPGDWCLLGVDLVKDPAVIEAAYNDAAGVTARFILNLFERMNRELQAGIDVRQVEYVGHFQPQWQRVEIWGRFRTRQTVRVTPLDRQFVIEAGEHVLVEISRKFVLEDLVQYLGQFGFEARRVLTDPRRWFAVLLLQHE